MALTWFITGSSRGFGRSLVTAALAAGDRVVATARRPETLADLVAEHGDAVLPVALDVTDPDAARAALEQGVARLGRPRPGCREHRGCRAAGEPAEPPPARGERRRHVTGLRAEPVGGGDGVGEGVPLGRRGGALPGPVPPGRLNSTSVLF